MTAISLSPLREYCYYLVRSSNIRVKGDEMKREKHSDKASIRDLVLTFCPTMRSVQQRKLKLLMLVFVPMDHMTDVCFVAWPLNESEAGDDLVSMETSLLFLC